MDKTIVERITAALKLSPAESARFQEKLQSAAAQLTTPPAKVQVNLHVAPSAHLHAASTAAVAGKVQGFQTELNKLSPALRKTMAQVEPKLLAWIAADNKNAAQFLTDPLTALRHAAPELSEATHAELARLRGSSPKPPAPAGFELTSLKLDAKTSRR